MTIETPDPTANTGPNLMLLKGIVWGLGVLLVLGMIGVAVGIAMRAGGGSSDPLDAGSPVVVELASGEDILSHAVEGTVAVYAIGRDNLPERYVYVDVMSGAARTVSIVRDVSGLQPVTKP